MVSTHSLKIVAGIPPTVVGGLFKFSLANDLKYPPTAVGGIRLGFRGCMQKGSEKNHPLPWVGLSKAAPE